MTKVLYVSVMPKDFAKAQYKSVDNKLPIGGWRVYPDYEVCEEDLEDGDRHIYVEATAEARNKGWIRYGKLLVPDRSGEEVYAPLHEHGLFVEFATLFTDGPVFPEDAAPVVLEWAKCYGTLGIHAPYPDWDDDNLTWGIFDQRHGWEWGRFDDRESVDLFVELSLEAKRCWQLYKALKAPTGPDTQKLRELKAMRELKPRGDTPEQLAGWAKVVVEGTVSTRLEKETFTRLYMRRDGTVFRAPGFRSLLGAMYLQMSNYLAAPSEEITFCKWCGDVVSVEESEPPPSDAPKGTRRQKHKTHKNRQYCKAKYGVENYCKNAYNYAMRKRKSAAK